MQGLKLLYRDFPELWEELRRLNDRVLYCKTLGQSFLEYKQMGEGDRTLKQWEERFAKELEYEKREQSLF